MSSFEYLEDDLAVLPRVPSLNFCKRRSRESQIFGRYKVGAQRAVSHLGHFRLSGYRYLVESIAAVHDERPGASELRQDLSKQLSQVSCVPADDSSICAGGICQRTEHIKNRTYAHLPARKRDILHRIVKQRRVKKPDTDFIDAPRDSIRR